MFFKNVHPALCLDVVKAIAYIKKFGDLTHRILGKIANPIFIRSLDSRL
ncbi:hypothetical protein [Pleurocapsa sp. FMAR1]|nr:hypothetical protein [Pleurocapsa sp. FMAR1]